MASSEKSMEQGMARDKLMEPKAIVLAIKKWARENIWKVLGIRDRTGVWEGWAKVELIKLIAAKYDNGGAALEIARDVYYESDEQKNQKNDLRICDARGTVVIQLECEGFCHKDFFSAVYEHIQTLKKCEFKGTGTAWVIAISVSQEAEDAINEMNIRTHEEWMEKTQEIFNDEMADEIGKALTDNDQDNKLKDDSSLNIDQKMDKLHEELENKVINKLTPGYRKDYRNNYLFLRPFSTQGCITLWCVYRHIPN